MRFPFTAFVQSPHEGPESQVFIPAAGRTIVAGQDANTKGWERYMFDLSGQVALITGASRGIGAAAAWSLAKHGACVVLAARSSGDIERIAEEIRSSWQADLAAFREQRQPYLLYPDD